MSDSRSEGAVSRSGTEYKLSVSSNPGSRRSSLGGNNDSFSSKSMNGSAIGFDGAAEQNVLQEYLVPQIRELTDSMITLDGNLVRLNGIHDNLIDLNESFGSLIYGILCTSACTDFPGISSNIERELRAVKRLQQLKQEKATLEQELLLLKNPNNEISSNSKKFSEPLFPVGANSRRITPANNYRNKPRKQQEHQSENNFDDNISEESFVINPPIQAPIAITNEPSKKSGKLRRRSILHTIRNSLLTDDVAGSRNNHVNNTGRASVVGLPSRTTERYSSQGPQGHPMRKRYFSSSTTRENASSNATRRVSKKRVVSKSNPIDNRPPFR